MFLRDPLRLWLVGGTLIQIVDVQRLELRLGLGLGYFLLRQWHSVCHTAWRSAATSERTKHLQWEIDYDYIRAALGLNLCLKYEKKIEYLNTQYPTLYCFFTVSKLQVKFENANGCNIKTKLNMHFLHRKSSCNPKTRLLSSHSRLFEHRGKWVKGRGLRVHGKLKCA